MCFDKQSRIVTKWIMIKKTLFEELLMKLDDNCFDVLKNNAVFIALKNDWKSTKCSFIPNQPQNFPTI